MTRAPGARGDDGALLDALRGVRWPARRPVRGLTPGAHESRVRGISAEFTEYRPYRQGDETRKIDWKLFARSDRAYIRLSHDRVVLPTSVVMDASASMAFPTGTRAKWELARQVAVGLCAVAHAGGDPVGLVIPAEPSPKQLAPRARRGAVSELSRVLGDVKPAGRAPSQPALAAALRTSARVVLVTDFLGDAEALLVTARQNIVHGYELYAIHIVDQAELDPPRDGVLLTDPEQPDLRRPMAEGARVAYLTAFAAWRETLAHRWRAVGGHYTMAVSAVEPADRIVRRIVADRVPVRAV